MQNPSFYQLHRVQLLSLAGVLVLAFLAFTMLSARQQNAANHITPEEAIKLIRTDTSLVILDVRTPNEFASTTGHLRNAILIPVQELENRVGELSPYKDRTILVYCRTGHRSTTASEILERHGFKVKNLEGGITKWRESQLPTVQQ